MKHGGPLKRRTPLAPMSTKRRRQLDGGERQWRRAELERRCWCEIGRPGCLGRATELHEVVKRSRGGSTTDPDNVRSVCHRCHMWTESEPALATALGFLAKKKIEKPSITY